ncbi:unnamed protein product [Triticum turgidum subsp. durum]|uniref:Tonoplast intrinsic protein n=1 Tax=Triticum turgidum subsp. durum TaxID=4567 RepID=A0A9R1C1T0_TRITD|nr:unnamed protein product [Triticum turgidum subsp. durum]
MPGSIAFGRFDDSFSLASFKAYIAEFISTLIFVFAGVGSAIAYTKVSGGAPLDPSGLIAVAICHGFGLFVAVAIGANISGGHVNPAVTFGLALGGQITILTGIFYWVAQLLGAIVGAFLVHTIAPIAIGFIVGANILVAGPFSGGSMNPARSFGPAVASGDFTNIWIYWAGPLIGGGLAGVVYRYLYMCDDHSPVAGNDY